MKATTSINQHGGLGEEGILNSLVKKADSLTNRITGVTGMAIQVKHKSINLTQAFRFTRAHAEPIAGKIPIAGGIKNGIIRNLSSAGKRFVPLTRMITTGNAIERTAIIVSKNTEECLRRSLVFESHCAGAARIAKCHVEQARYNKKIKRIALFQTIKTQGVV